MHQALHPSDDMVCMCQEKNGREDSPALRIALMDQYKKTRITLKRAKKDLLQQAVLGFAI